MRAPARSSAATTFSTSAGFGAVSYPGDLVEHLRAFSILSAIIESGSGASAFGRAAVELAIDQSVLRRRLSTLADFVGSPVLTGRGPKLRLTPAGLRLRAQAAQMIELATSIATPKEDEEGPLRIACTGTILAEVLPNVLATMRDRHLKLRFRVRREGDEGSRRLLAKGEVDFGIVRSMVDLSGPSQKQREEHRGSHPTNASTPLHARRLAEDRLWVAMPANTPLARAKRVSLGEIAKSALIGYPPTSATMKRLMTVLSPLGAAPWIEVDRKAAALAYVAANLGVAFVSLVANQTPRHRNVVLRDVTTLFPRMAFWLVWPPDAMPLTGWRADFVDRLMAAMRR